MSSPPPDSPRPFDGTSTLEGSGLSISLGDRWVYSWVALCVLLGLAGRPLLEFNDPSLPAVEAFRAGAARDPWGQSFQHLEVSWEGNPDPWVARSAGPNGVFEDDDDLLIPAAKPSPSLSLLLYRALRVAPWVLVALLAGAWELLRYLRRPRQGEPSLARDALVAGALGLPLAVAATLALELAFREGGAQLRAAREQAAEVLVLPFWLAIFATSWALIALGLAALLAARPPAIADEADPVAN